MDMNITNLQLMRQNMQNLELMMQNLKLLDGLIWIKGRQKKWESGLIAKQWKLVLFRLRRSLIISISFLWVQNLL